MHDLATIYNKVKGCLLSQAKEYFIRGENAQFYPNPPKLSDLEVLALSITAESVQIDSENLLWSLTHPHSSICDRINRGLRARKSEIVNIF